MGQSLFCLEQISCTSKNFIDIQIFEAYSEAYNLIIEIFLSREVEGLAH